jgi:hypothetical protein
MTLQTTGRISLGDVQKELNDTGSIGLSEEMVRSLAGDDGGQISLSQLYGKAISVGDYVWTSLSAYGSPGENREVTIPIAMSAGTRIMIVYRMGSGGNCGGTSYATTTLPDYGITLQDGSLAGYWGGQGPDNWGQWRVSTINTAIPAGARLSITRNWDGCAMCGTTQIYVASGYPTVMTQAEYDVMLKDGWTASYADYIETTESDTTPVDNGTLPSPVLSPDTPARTKSYGSVYWYFGGAAQTTIQATTSFDIKAGASCIIRGGFIKPGGNYNVTANVRLTSPQGTFYEASIASWYGGHGDASQPLAGYEFTAPFDIPSGTVIDCYHYTSGQYGDGTSCDYVYLDVVNLA